MHLLYLLQLISSNALNLRRDKSILYNRVTIVALVFISIVALNNLNTTSLATGLGLYGTLLHVDALNQAIHVFIYIITTLILCLTAFYPYKYNSNNLNHSTIKSKIYLIIHPFIKPGQTYKATDASNKSVEDKLDTYNKDMRYDNVYAIKENKEAKFQEDTGNSAESYKIGEYPLIISFIISGAILLTCSNDTITIFLSIELQSYGLYLLATIYRNSESSTGAGLTYFLLGSLSSCFILLAIGLLYVNTGTTSLEGFYVINNLESIKSISPELSDNFYTNFSYIGVIFILFLTGFFFKISAAPFHFWSPDVYDSIPTVVTTFVAILAKISILVLLLEIMHYVLFTVNLNLTSELAINNTINTVYNSNYSKYSILLSSVLSMIIGTVLGLNQSRIKRLYAYSTISHLGFILLALSINSLESVQAFVFYLIQYSIVNLNAFLLLIVIGYISYNNSANNTPEKKYKYNDRENSPVQFVSQLKGFMHVNPYVAISLAITIFSFTGIPPLVGFFAKQVVLSVALDNGYVFIVFIAILTSVISAVYYLNIVKHMYFYDAKLLLNNNTIVKSQKVLSGSITIIISVITLSTLLFILNSDILITFYYTTSLYFFNP